MKIAAKAAMSFVRSMAVKVPFARVDATGVNVPAAAVEVSVAGAAIDDSAERGAGAIAPEATRPRRDKWARRRVRARSTRLAAAVGVISNAAEISSTVRFWRKRMA